MTANFNKKRQDLVRFMFDRLDIKAKKQVDLNILGELFTPRQTFFVKNGRKTLEETKQMFEDYLSTFQDLLNG